MGIFNKLFGASQTNEPKAYKKNNLQELFKINLSEIPDASFIETGSEKNVLGSIIYNFQKKLDYLECNIFDTIEIKKFDDGSKNVFFKKYSLNSVNISDVEKIINELVSLNGSDDSGQGLFNSTDENRFYSTQFDVVFGRKWLEQKRYRYNLRLGISRDTNDITLVIYG